MDDTSDSADLYSCVVRRSPNHYILWQEELTAYPPFKKLGLDLATLTKKRAIDLMMDEPNLIKRPIVVKGKKAVFGFKPEEM